MELILINILRFFKDRHLLIVLLTTVHQISFAQDSYTVSGQIVSEDGESLPMSVVEIINTEFKITTDLDGFFMFENVPGGNYTIHTQYVGFFPENREIQVSQNLELKITLQNNTKTLNEVVVEHNIADDKKEEGYAVEVIDTKDYHNQAIELNQILDQTSGVKVRQDGGLGSRSRYMINGLGDKAVRFFLDGIPMDYFGTAFSINTIPVSLIDRIEVYKGVVPVELGNDALGGVINLVTKKDLDNAAEVSYSYGSFNTHRASVFGNFTDKKTGLTARVSAFYNYSDNNYWVWGEDIYATNLQTYEVERNLKVRRFHDKFESKAIKTDIGFVNKKWADQFFIGVVASDLDKDIQHGSTMEIPYGEATYHQNGVLPYLVYKKYDLVKGLDVNLFTSYSNLKRLQVDTSRNTYDWYGNIIDTLSDRGERTFTLNSIFEQTFLSRVNLIYNFNKNHKIGFNYVATQVRRTENDPTILTKNNAYWDPQYFNKNIAGLVYESSLFEDKLNTSIFLKYYEYNADIKFFEFINNTKNYQTAHTHSENFGYGLAGSYKLTSYLMFTGSLEQAARLPESDEILGDGNTTTATTDLNPETSFNINGGTEISLFQNTENKVQISSNFFYRDVKNLIQRWAYSADAFEYTNLEKVLIKGVDAKIEWKHRRDFSVSQSVSYLNPVSKYETDKLGDVRTAYNARIPNTPFFQTSTVFRYYLNNLLLKKSKTFFYYNINYVGSFYRFNETSGKFNKDEIPAQLVNSCGMGYTFPKEKISLSVDASNIFNEQVFDNFAIQKPGRAFYFKITYRII